MSPRIILVLAALGSVFPLGAIETAADERTSEERRFLTDFRSLRLDTTLLFSIQARFRPTAA
jgi:hypothetical protein